MTLLVTTLNAPPAEAAEPALPQLQKLTKVGGKPVAGKPAPPSAESQLNAWTAPPKVAWPAAGSAEIDVPAASVPGTAGRRTALLSAPAAGPAAPEAPGTKAGTLPVRVGSATPPKSAAAGARSTASASSVPAAAGSAPAGDGVKVRVGLHDRAAAGRAGVTGGLLLSVQRTDARTGDAPVSVELDYNAFKNAYGGGWGSRLRFTALPACALTTPDRPECRTGTPVSAANDPRTGTLTATVDAPAPAAATAPGSFAKEAPAASARGMLAPAAVAAPVVLAAAPTADGANGTFKATSLSPTGSWQAGGSAGDFSWSYPLEIPASLGGPSPSLALGYSSAQIDGRTSASSQQTSWIGDGWDMASNFIERSFVPCSQDKKDGSGFNNPKDDTGDLCHGAPMLTLSLNGGSTALILDDRTKQWKPANDDGSRVELMTGAANGDRTGEHWRVTTAQGVQFWFGLNRVPGWTTGKPVTNSALLVPVYGNQPGEDCFKAGDFANSVCDQAYRWNLDYVVDPRGNAMTYWYNKEVNHYG
ncbi:RHS repeat protein, partial [Streptomyces subrutilus]